jgi:Ca2+/Na+ antiporter
LAWDANRPVPWRRLAREAGIFLVVGGLALTLLVKHKQPGTYLGLVLGMIFYVAFIAILSKFGYQRQSIRQARERRQAMAPRPTSTSTSTARQRPAPTRRTSTGPSQRPNRSTKKRRR